MMEYRHTLDGLALTWLEERLIVAFRSKYEPRNAEDCYDDSHKYDCPATHVS